MLLSKRACDHDFNYLWGDIKRTQSQNNIQILYPKECVAKKKKNHVTHGWQGCEEIGILINCWTEVN